MLFYTAATATTVATVTSAETSALTVTNILSTDCTDYSSYVKMIHGTTDYSTTNKVDIVVQVHTFSGISYQLWLSGTPLYNQ